MLASTNAMDIAAGVWLAGFHPEWGLSTDLASHLSHPRGEVRRSAAEALGRVGGSGAGDAILAALEKEWDAHALGDQIEALARLRHVAFMRTCERLAEHPSAFVRRQDVRAANIFATATNVGGKAASDTSAWALSMAERATQEKDLRVGREGMRLMSALDGRLAVETAARGCSVPKPDPAVVAAWSEALALSEGAFSAYVQGNFPGGDSLLLAVAGRRADADMAEALGRRLGTISKENKQEWVVALVRQRSRRLALTVFEMRGRLPGIADDLPYILECAFGAGLGSDMEAWSAWLASQPTSTR
jgi:hypothetical protein